jgi:hypothetical protein
MIAALLSLSMVWAVVSFPESCGLYKVQGELRGQPWRIVLFAGTASEKTVRVQGTCRSCEHFEGLPVEAEVRFLRKGASDAELKSVRAVVPDPDQDLSLAVRRLKREQCRD